MAIYNCLFLEQFKNTDQQNVDPNPIYIFIFHKVINSDDSGRGVTMDNKYEKTDGGTGTVPI